MVSDIVLCCIHLYSSAKIAPYLSTQSALTLSSLNVFCIYVFTLCTLSLTLSSLNVHHLTLTLSSLACVCPRDCRYRAPECLLTDGHYTYKMDMWSVGCVMYEVMRSDNK